MKSFVQFLLVLAFAVFLGTTTPSTNRALQFDGLIGSQSGAAAGTNGTFWEVDENLGGSDNVSWYITWGQFQLFIGREGGSNTDTSYFFARIDQAGATYSDTLPDVSNFRPTFANLGGINYYGKLQKDMSEGGAKHHLLSGTWGGLTTYVPGTVMYSAYLGTDNMEAQFEWYEFTMSGSKPDTMYVVFYQANTDSSYGESPSENPDGLTPNITHWWKYNSVNSVISPNDPGYALPVQLSSFVAVASGSQVELHWTTSTETGNYGFEVERRPVGFDGVEWKRVAFVMGAGVSTSTRTYALVDQKLTPGRYAYRLKQINTDGTFEYSWATEVTVGSIPQSLSISGNYPNPFNPSTTIEFSVPENGDTRLDVIDIAGRQVASLFNGTAQSGRVYSVRFNATELTTGMYFARLSFAGRSVVRKMVLAK